MNNYNEKILEILEEQFLDNLLERYFENDKITNRHFRINSSLLSGKFDPLYFTGMNVIIAHLVSKYQSFGELKLNILSGDPYKSKFFGIGDYKLLRIRDIKRNYIDFDNATVIPESQFRMFPNSKAQLNDIVIGMDGDEFRAAIIKEEHLPCAINQRVTIIRGLPEDKAIYYMLAINSYIGVYQLERVRTLAGTVGHISMDDIRNLRFPIDDNYKKFVQDYKTSISKIIGFVGQIKTESDALRLDTYSRLDLKPSKVISDFISQ